MSISSEPDPYEKGEDLVGNSGSKLLKGDHAQPLELRKVSAFERAREDGDTQPSVTSRGGSTNFKRSYRQANICSKFFFHFAQTLIGAVRKNKGLMTEAMIEDMSLRDENQTEVKTDKFKSEMNSLLHKWQRGKKNHNKSVEQAPWNSIVSSALVKTFRRDFWLIVAFSFVAELLFLICVFLTA